MNKIRPGLAVLLLVILSTGLAACGGSKFEPQAIHEETDVCAICNMTVRDDQFAAQIITKDGQVFKFDDVGCMNEWKNENGTDQIGAAFVRDYHTKVWIPYEDAFYVYDASFQTPMAYGVLSFEKEADAQAFIEEQGKGVLMNADELAGHTWERAKNHMEHQDQQHGQTGHDQNQHDDSPHDQNHQQQSEGHSS